MTHPVGTEAGEGGGLVADPQAALRRVGTLVAEGVPAAELFAAVVEEVEQGLDVPAVVLGRYEPERATTVLASLNAPGYPVGRRVAMDGPGIAATVFDTGRPARVDDSSESTGPTKAGGRDSAFNSAVGVPIIVDARVWGLMCVGTAEREPLPGDTEARLGEFTELVGTAISNAESRDRRRRLADEQAALRRVATLVAEGATPDELFSAVAHEVARILDVSAVSVVRFESHRASVVVASLNDPSFPVGSRWPYDGHSLNARVFETGRPARINYSELPGPVAAAARTSGVQSGVGVPIIVDGSVWGMVAVGRRHRRATLPVFAGSYTSRIVLSTESTDETEARLTAFTELVATAISKAQAHDDLRRLAEEQAALRRVATLVAAAAPPNEIFAAVAEEVARILGLARIEMVRYEPDGTGTVLGASGDHPFPTGSRWTLDGESIMASVLRTGRPARIDDYSDLPGKIAEVARGAGFRSAIGAPIVVDGRIWGTIIAISTSPEPIPEGSEIRLSQFTELVATAVSNATAQADLIASRARIVAAGDEARRRIERNLHDGTQQRLIALGLDLQRIRATVPEDRRAAGSGLERVQRDLESVLEEVRELSRGLHPALLSRGGLAPSLKALARKSPIRVDMDVDVEERPEASIETAVYYVVSEALTNAIKHSHASAISVAVATERPVLRATIADDGVGGAVAGAGSGLTGLSDRVEALGGRFALESPPGRGTRISIELPIATPAGLDLT